MNAPILSDAEWERISRPANRYLNRFTDAIVADDEALRARVAVLEAGLRPFAEYADGVLDMLGDDVAVAARTQTGPGVHKQQQITVSDLRCARALLGGVPAAAPEPGKNK